MIPVNDKIFVTVDDEQKDTMLIGEVLFSTALKYEVNYREKSPVIAKVVNGNEVVKEGQYLLCHHNLFYLPSPHHISDDLHSIPFNKSIFAIINHDGSLQPICGNIFCDRVEKQYDVPVPPEHIEKYIDRVVVKNGGWTMYKEGDLLFTRHHAYYEIVYMLNSVEHRIHKVHEEMVMGVVKRGES